MLGIAGALVAVAALISTALAQAEAKTDLATLAALGATTRTRRALAGSQALVVALLGAGLGVLVGLAPGVVLAIGLTGDSSLADPSAPPPPAIVVVPWLGLSAVVVAVPLLAALLAAASVRRIPVMTRRPT